MIGMGTKCGLWQHAVAAVFLLAAPTALLHAAERTPYGRTTSSQTCTDVLRSLFAAMGESETFDKRHAAIGLTAKHVPPGSACFTRSGHLAVRKPGSQDLKDVVVLEPGWQNRPSDATPLLKSLLDTGSPVTITGNEPLSTLVRRATDAGIPRSAKNVYFSVELDGILKEAKRHLLATDYKGVEFFIDVGFESEQLRREVGRLATSAEPRLPSNLGRVSVQKMSDLPGSGTIADRLRNSPPEPGVLRFNFAHHKGGIFAYSDGSSSEAAALARSRLKDGRSEVDLGCNLFAPSGDGWVVIRGEILGQDVAKMAAAIETALSDAGAGGKVNGAKIMESLTVLDSGEGRTSFKLLNLLPIGLAAAFTESATAAADAAPGAVPGGGFTYQELQIAGERVADSTGWFDPASPCHRKMINAIAGVVLDRPVLYLDRECDIIALFQPTRNSGAQIQTPVFMGKLGGAVDAAGRRRLEALATQFWFLVGPTPSREARLAVLDWQERADVTLPFVFIDLKEETLDAAAELVRPFMRGVTAAGEAMPRSDEEARASGAFWCRQHETQQRLDRYRQLISDLPGPPPTLDLRGESRAELARLWKDQAANVWLVGAWTDTSLLRHNGSVSLSEWVDRTSCQSRVTFVSAFAVSRPTPGRYYEPVAHDWLPKAMASAARASGSPEQFREQFRTLMDRMKETPALIAVSSCGKYLLVSE
jgi:hypothetical protein